MEDKKVKGLKVRVLDDTMKNLGLTVSTSNLESYFGRKDGEAFAKVEIFKEGNFIEDLSVASNNLPEIIPCE